MLCFNTSRVIPLASTIALDSTSVLTTLKWPHRQAIIRGVNLLVAAEVIASRFAPCCKSSLQASCKAHTNFQECTERFIQNPPCLAHQVSLPSVHNWNFVKSEELNSLIRTRTKHTKRIFPFTRVGSRNYDKTHGQMKVVMGPPTYPWWRTLKMETISF